MTIWAIADLHLAISVPEKTMEIFGDQWKSYMERIKHNWTEVVSPDDLVLLAGDISWAMRPEEARVDLEWIDRLPGTKVMIRGNHDYWWVTLSKVKKICPPSIHPLQNNCFLWGQVAIGGARLWDTPEFAFDDNTRTEEEKAHEEKIFVRELYRLELSLQSLPNDAKVRIVMTHYPPISSDLTQSRASQLLTKYDVDLCVFGHLHNVPSGSMPFGQRGGVKYLLTACDYLNCVPLKISD